MISILHKITATFVNIVVGIFVTNICSTQPEVIALKLPFFFGLPKNSEYQDQMEIIMIKLFHWSSEHADQQVGLVHSFRHGPDKIYTPQFIQAHKLKIFLMSMSAYYFNYKVDIK